MYKLSNFYIVGSPSSSDQIQSISWKQTGETLAYGSKDKKVNVLDLRNASSVQVMQMTCQFLLIETPRSLHIYI